MGEITQLIQGVGQGSPGAVDRLFELLYADLHRIAHSRLRASRAAAGAAGGPQGLDTTSLVHESFLRLVRLQKIELKDRGHFLTYAARAMRSVVVDLVRQARADRHGGGLTMVTLDTGVGESATAGDEQILAVHEALADLARIDARLVSVVEMRFFVGLEMDEIAQALGVAKRTVERDWEKARSFLYSALKR